MRLKIISRHDVSYRAKSRCLNRGGWVHKEVHETAANSGFDDGLDLVVGPVGKVRNGPASVNEDLVIKGVDEFGQNAKSGGDLK